MLSCLFRKDSVVIYMIPQPIVEWLAGCESFKGNTRIVKKLSHCHILSSSSHILRNSCIIRPYMVSPALIWETWVSTVLCTLHVLLATELSKNVIEPPPRFLTSYIQREHVYYVTWRNTGVISDELTLADSHYVWRRCIIMLILNIRRRVKCVIARWNEFYSFDHLKKKHWKLSDCLGVVT